MSLLLRHATSVNKPLHAFTNDPVTLCRQRASAERNLRGQLHSAQGKAGSAPEAGATGKGSSSIEQVARLMKRLAAPLLVLGSLVFALALGELFLRLIDFSYQNFYLPDDYTGTSLRPGVEGWSRSDGEAYIRINIDRLRDREHSKAKPLGTVRIAVLGYSFAEAAQVPLEATFWAHLERELTASHAFGQRRVEVLNFGVSGYGTAQELLTLRHRAWSYSPDIVLLAFFPGNDVRNNSKVLEPEKLRPFFVIRDG